MPFFCLAHQSSFIEIELTLRIYAQEIGSVISVGHQAYQHNEKRGWSKGERGALGPDENPDTRERPTDPREKRSTKKPKGQRRRRKRGRGGGCGVQGRAVIQPAALFRPVGRTEDPSGIVIMVSPGADARLEICNPDSLIRDPKDSTAI